MSELRRSIIHAALEAGDNTLAEWLLGARYVARRTLNMYAAHYGI